MMNKFGETKEYCFGKITDTRSGRIRVVRVCNKIIYERIGESRYLFNRTPLSVCALFEKIITSVVFVVSMILFLSVAFVALVIAVVKTSVFFLFDRKS